MSVQGQRQTPCTAATAFSRPLHLPVEPQGRVRPFNANARAFPWAFSSLFQPKLREAGARYPEVFDSSLFSS
jgi:hypothetical protein